ncbi:hypothetical protein GCM10010211_33790 [Streptomyces albospinus]|uniref:Uncharacterized protein n=1 Tax=Streptomyces albospinus TaxID=285515 RepID=A0ABQ2V2Y8_9ACTN|nr:hypothetical protein [Streptomyces albospinus]GGU65801.1 hypothetical protein GCM10010211_33790 [Streptomyces albospinus]
MVTPLSLTRWHGMTKMRRAFSGVALATVVLGPMSAQAVAAAPKDDTPIQPHVTMPLSGLFTDHGTPVNWSILDYRL